MTSKTIDPMFDGLAFPVAKVRYTGNGYSATIVRDVDRKYSARVSYDHAIGTGPKNAVRAAWKAFDKLAAENEGIAMDGEHLAVPGDLNSDFYVFTFVPARFFAR